MAANNNFFISYTGKDKLWAEWIGRTLREKGYTTDMQSFDFAPGSNLAARIDNALKNCDRYISVFTPDYFTSAWCTAEWSVALETDPSNRNGKMVPVRTEECTPEGLMAPFVYIDLVGLDEAKAAEALIQGINPPGKPAVKPVFPENKSPGKSGPAYPPAFPVNNLPARNVNFTGRDEVIDEIRRAFKSAERAVLTGPQGAGKSQAAYEFAYGHAGGYGVIWEFDAQSFVSLLTGYAGFAHRMGIVDEKIFDSGAVINSVKDWMAQNERWLFLFVNAKRYESLEYFLPEKCGGNILITSDNEAWENILRIPVDVFRAKEAIEFLLNGTRLDDRMGAAKLAEELGYFPLGLGLAAAYIPDMKEPSFFEYTGLFQEYRLKIYKTAASKPKDYAMTAGVAWRISSEKIKNDGAKQLLYICSYFSGENIDKEIFTQSADCLPAPLSGTVKSRSEYDSALSELSGLSLIKYDGRNLRVHGLLSEAARGAADKKEWLGTCLKITREKFRFERSPDSWGFFSSLLGHALSIAGHAEEEKTGLEEAARIYADSGRWLMQTAAYEEALISFRKALAASEEAYGEEHADTAQVYVSLGEAYLKSGEYERALERYKKALEIIEKVSGKEHPETAGVCNNIGMVYRQRGEYEKALEWHGKALSIYEKDQEKENMDAALACNGIAMVYDDQGDYDKALGWYAKALEICEKVSGIEHPDTAAIYGRVGAAYRKQRNHMKALEWYGKALRINEKVSGRGHPDTAAIYGSIAAVYYDLEDSEKALEWYEKALGAYEKAFGAYNPDTARICGDISWIYHAQGDFEKAFDMLLRALKVYVKRKITGLPEAKNVIKGLQINYLKAGGKIEDFQKWLIEKMKEE